MSKKTLNFKKGDTVQGLLLSDIKEDLGQEVFERKEKIEKIEDDGDGYFYIHTDFTKKQQKEIDEKNAKLGEDDDKTNTAWYINSEFNSIKVLKTLKKKNLTKIGGTITKDFVMFDHIEIPIKMFEALRPFVEYLEDRDVSEFLDVEEEVLLTISGMEFTPSMLKTILG
jgi:hypothetical protein